MKVAKLIWDVYKVDWDPPGGTTQASQRVLAPSTDFKCSKINPFDMFLSK